MTRAQRFEPSAARVRAITARLFELLPGLYRTKELLLAPEGQGPLEGFLGVFAHELARFEEATRALEDDHFVERASVEALPLLAELYGVDLLGENPRINRALIAKGIAWRRRKGTPFTLAEMLSVTTGWSVDVHEGYRSLMLTQDVGHVVATRGRLDDLRDPIVLQDPLARRAKAPLSPLAVRPGEALDDARRRIGRVDAGRAALSPRTVDFRGWARPEAVLVRASVLVAVELEEVPVVASHESDGRRVLSLDPLNRPTPIVWLEPSDVPELDVGLSAEHEPDPAPPARRTAAALLTPTALAQDPDAAEAAGALALRVAGVPILGPSSVASSSEDLAYEPLGADPKLRFADPSRPSPGDRYLLELVALRSKDGAFDPLVDRVVAHAEAKPGETGVVETTTDARNVLGGAVVGLRISRSEGQGAVFATTLGVDDVKPLATDATVAASNLVIFGAVGARRAVRAEIVGTRLRLATLALDAAGSAWTSIELPRPLAAMTGVALVATSDGVILVAPDADPTRVALHRVVLEPAVAMSRFDAGVVAQPPYRASPSLLLDGDRLYLFGGVADGAIAADLWSFSSTTRAWTPHLVRNRQARAGATLLKQWGRLVSVGGQSAPGQLEPNVMAVDLAVKRPTWTQLASLPASVGAPGVAFARATATGIEAMLWADRTRPIKIELPAIDAAWRTLSTAYATATNPPAQGDAAYADEMFFVLGAPALPPSEIIFSLGGRSRLAFLPALELAPGTSQLFVIGADGSTRRRAPALDDARPRAPYASDLRRAADEPRLNVPGRLSPRPFVLRQRAFGAWAAPIAIAETRDDVIGFDPRNGRVVLPPSAPPGDVTASYRVGRGGHLGAGCMPQGRRLPSFWEEPGAPAPTPPDLLPERASLSAYVDPTRAGLSQARRGESIAIFATAEEALTSAREDDAPILGILGAPKLPPATLVGGQRGLSLVAVDHAHAPLFAAPPTSTEASLAIFSDFGGTADTSLWLAGLWLAGRLDLVLARGRADVRWCTLGAPGEVALRVPGASSEGAARTFVEPEIEIRLYGCLVGAIELPSWVRLIAAGCTFDGGDAGPAIRARGAEVHLRHCTVRGATEAGRLFASSSVFSGPINVARPSEGWLRYCVTPPRKADARPRSHASIEHPIKSASASGPLISFGSLSPTDPRYLVLADNNGPLVLGAGELGRIPGAHGERTDSLRELAARTTQHLPVGMVSVHHDRAMTDLARMGRSFP
jgi:hypothetical protein